MPTKLHRRIGTLLVAFSAACFAPAQTANTGSIEGRVQNVTKGDYLNYARVTVENTNLSALTDEFGQYAIGDVPAGQVKIHVFYTGLPAETATVTVPPGGRVVQNFNLGAQPASDVVKLEAYTVTSTHEMSQAAIATNEQRFAPNMKTVLSAEQFGEQSENNVAEFLKLMPGVQISYVDQDARNASLRGLPAYATVVTENGNQVASAASSLTSRVFEFEQISMNDIARVEVNKTLVPDMPAEGIGGTINVITKSAFERSRPSFQFRTYLNFNTTAMDLKKTPGPFRDETYKVRPGFDFTYINPISKNFGVTVSGSRSDKYNPQWYGDTTWNLNLNKATGIENPFVSGFVYYDGPKSTERDAGRVAFDWRFAPNDVFTFGFSEEYYRALIGLRRMSLSLGSNPTEITPQYVQGRTGAASEYMGASQNDKSGTTWTPEFKYTHNGPIWRVEAGGAYSHSGNDYYATDKGFFSGVGFSMHGLNPDGTYTNPTFRFNYTGNYTPEVVATLSNGATANPRDVTQLYLDNASALRRKSTDLKKTLRLNAQRMFDFGFPLRVKFGGDVREAVRDIRESTPNWTFVGPDGVKNNADNLAGNYDLVDTAYSSVTTRMGQPAFKWFDVYKAYALYRAHPDWWQLDEVGLHNNLVDKSKFITERITSGFIRLDAQFFHNRLLLTGGWRYQQYKVHTESGEVDNTGKYLTDADGNLVLDPKTNKPILLPGDPLTIAGLTNIDRGIIRNATQGNWYPSVNATYRITDNLQFRAAYGKSISYPDLGYLLGSTYVSDPTVSSPYVLVYQPLKPWMAQNYDLELEYFTRNGGSMSLSWWHKDMSGFISSGSFYDAAGEAELTRLGYQSLIPLHYYVREMYNTGETTMEGWEAALTQNLDRWTPSWAHGIDIFANTSYKGPPRTTSGTTDIDADSRRFFNWGGSYHRDRFVVTLKFNRVEEPKRLFYSMSATHDMSRTYTDMDIAIRLTRHLSVFASGTNIFGVPVETFVYDPATPVYAMRRAHHFYGVQCIAGVKGTF